MNKRSILPDYLKVKRIPANLGRLPEYLKVKGLGHTAKIYGYNQRRGHEVAGAMVTTKGGFFATFKTNCPEFKSILMSEPYVKPLEARIIRGLSR